MEQNVPRPGRKPVIYLLDDEPEMLSLLNDMVEDLDLKAQCFDRAKFFFEQITEFSPDSMLVLDLHMPEMDGIEVMRRLATIDNPPALLLISGHDTGVLHSAEKLGKVHNLEIISSLNKPIHLGNFQRLLKQYCSELGKPKGARHSKIGNGIAPEELLNAIENKQMILYYQPQYNIIKNELISCEALIRWQHPQKGLIFPDEFIPMTEVNGWMNLLTRGVIRQAVTQEQKWHNEGMSLPISVNISADDITSLALPEQVTKLLAANQLNPTMLTLEVTESALMGELVTSLDILTRLRLKGIGLSIDDFGTGYSSLSQLHKIPFSELKVDREFVISMLKDNEARAIVKTCIMLGHELNMQVVAEGVESQQHLDLLRDMGCDIAQGYYFSKPVTAGEITKMLRKNIQAQTL